MDEDVGTPWGTDERQVVAAARGVLGAQVWSRGAAVPEFHAVLKLPVRHQVPVSWPDREIVNVYNVQPD